MKRRSSYVDAPELLNRVEGDDLLQEVIPIMVLEASQYEMAREMRVRERAFPLGGLVNQRVHSCINGCLTLKLSLSWKTVTGSSELLGFETAASCASDSPESLSLVGEIGMVSSGTGEVGLPLVAGASGASRVAMLGCSVRLTQLSSEKR